MQEFIAVAARHRRAARARSSRTTRSTPTSTRWPGPTPRTGGCSRPLPSAMIFDDHDIRDDWNTSVDWRQRDGGRPSWWHGRIVAGLASYWVYQHLGNLSPERAGRGRDLAARCWPRRATTSSTSTDVARRVRRPRRPAAGQLPVELHPRHRRQARLVVVDSRAARVLEPGRPRDARRRRDGLARRAAARRRRPPPHRHLAAVPAARGLHHLEAFSEALAAGRLGRARRPGRARRCGRASTSSTGARSSELPARSPRW